MPRATTERVLAATEDDAHGEEDALHACDGLRYPHFQERSQSWHRGSFVPRNCKGRGLTCPICARTERDAEHHEDGTGGLNAHHGDIERADELDARYAISGGCTGTRRAR